MGNTVKLRDLDAAQKAWLATPHGFAKAILGLPIYDRAEPKPAGTCARGGVTYYDIVEGDLQKQILDAIEPPGSRVSALTCNGAGKTSTILTSAILWHMAVFPHSLFVSTAGVYRQLKDQLWPSLEMQAQKFPGWEFKRGSLEIAAPNGSRYKGFVTDDAGKAEGYHGNKNPFYDLQHDKGPLFIAIDEAKSVPDPIFQAVDRCTYQRLLYASSSGLAGGEFYRSQTAAGSPFKRFRIRAADCPHLDHDKNAEIIAKRGLDHPLVRSTIFAEFMSDPEGVVIPLRVILDAMERGPDPQGQGRHAFCDFAAGGDENVIALREGNQIRLVKCWRETNTMAAVGQFILEFRQLNLEPHQITVDADGLGKPMADALAESGWPVNRESNGRQAHDAYSYVNRGAEIWHEGAETLKRREFALPDDEELKGQLCGRRSKVNSRGQLALETKDEMRRRGLASPDRADAVLGAMICGPRQNRETAADDPFAGLIDSLGEQTEIEAEAEMGIHAG